MVSGCGFERVLFWVCYFGFGEKWVCLLRGSKM